MPILNHLRAFALIAAIPMFHPAFAAPAQAATVVPTRFDVEVSGKGRDVILIPGLASSAHVWDATIAQLRGHYRVHVLQVAGFAGTPAGGNAHGAVIAPLVAELHAYIAAQKLNAPLVIGHSMGGLIGLMLAADHPGDVGKLMVVDALPWFGMMFGPQATMEGMLPRAAAMRDSVLNGGQATYAAVEPRQMATLIKSRTPAADAAIAAASASDHDVVARALYDDLTTDVRPRLPGVKIPVTMLYPWDASTGAPQAMFDALYTKAYAPLTTARVKRIDGSFHFIMIDQPEAFAREVADFVK